MVTTICFIVLSGRRKTAPFLSQEKKIKGAVKRTRVDFKTKFAAEKGLINSSTKASVDALYDLRNNIHILKAANSRYNPKLREAKDAFILMRTFVNEIKEYYTNHPTSTDAITEETE